MGNHFDATGLYSIPFAPTSTRLSVAMAFVLGEFSFSTSD